MPTEIDSLSISINAKAQTANRQIDALVGRLDILQKSLGKLNGGSANLVGVANGVDRLGKAMQTMNAVKTADFTRLATNLAKLGNINVSALNSTASSLSHLTRAFNTLGGVSTNAMQVGELAKNLGKLGGKSVTNAITNIPQLATAMNNLMTTLSKAPKVSENVIKMTNALANLSANGSKVGSASKSIARGLNTVNNSATRARSSFGGLASAIGRFYASYFLIIRAFKGLWKSINSTADYVEAFNYFTVSMGKVASKWDEKWSKYADQNAKNYSNTFFTTLTKSFEKLSGISYNPETGLLSETGLKNLGLNLREVTQYAAQLSSMMDAVGQSGETTLATTNAFVKLAGDISSLYNIDYQNAADKIRSVLQGQSRAGYGFGWDTTMAALQSTADSLDLSKAVSEMTQMEKQQLRILTILDQSRVAWGDQSNTINTLANQIRIFKNNISETSMVLGQLFVPILSKLMPVINGITIAIKRLLSSIAGLLGLELGDTGQGFADLGEDMEDVADGFGDATNAAKKFKAQLLGIDEINNLTSGDTGGGAGGIAMNTIDLTEQIKKATEEYEKAWNEAYSRMKNKAQQIADKIDKILAPIKGVFANLFNGQYYAAGYGFGSIFTDIFNWLSSEIDKVDWKEIGNNIGEFIAGIKWLEVFKSFGNLAGTIIEAIFDAWGGIFEKAPLETALVTAFGALSLTGVAGTIWGKIATALSATISGSSIGLVPTIAIGAITWKIGFDVGKSLGKALFPDDAVWYDDFKWFGDKGFFDEVFDDLGTTVASFYDMVSENPFISIMLFGWHGAIFSSIPKEIRDIISNILHIFDTEGLSGVGGYISEPFAKAFNAIKDKIDRDVKPLFTKQYWSNLLSGFKDGFVSVFTGAITVVVGRMNKFIESIEKMINLGILALNKLIENINPFGPLLDFAGIDIKIKDVSLGRIPIPQYKYGGFPEDGLFMANHSELVGGFSNGKTAVANNGQIIEGIEGGVERAVSRVLAPYLEDIAQNTRETANKDFSISRKQVFNAVREESRIFKKSTGAPAFS